MKIVVIGGTGLIGSKLVKLLRERGQEVLAASPDSGVNTLTGEGLPEALAGAQVVVDVSNSPSFEDTAVLKFFQTSTGNLLAAEATAGVGHHVALSIVGADRLPQSGYLRAKIAQENLIKGSGDSIQHPALHAVLRIHGPHRRFGHGRKRRAPAHRLRAAHRLGRGGGRARRRRDGRADQRHGRSRRSREVPSR